MHARRVIISVVLIVAGWAALAAWQMHEYRHERDAARQVVRRQAEALTAALVGGIRSHRRVNPMFDEQIQGLLDEMATPADVLAAAIVDADGRRLASAGEAKLLEGLPSLGEKWAGDAAVFVSNFTLAPAEAGPSGGGGGRGWGRGRGQWQQAGAPSPFAGGGDFQAAIVLDAAQVVAAERRAFSLRLLLTLAGGAVLSLVGVAWLSTMRLVEARGRARTLEAEARHLGELAQAAAGLAHETRNPLGLVRGWAQRLAESHLPTSEQREQAHSIVEECDRVTARINQFLAFARPREPQPEEIEPRTIIDDLAMLIQSDLEAKELTLVRKLPAEPVRLRGDAEMLRQALFNLLTNAIHFAPRGSMVEVAVDHGANGSCRMAVSDVGPGVPPERAQALFTPYFTTRPGGTGLGLAIVRRIATAHGWSAGYEPRPGGGATFWLETSDGGAKADHPDR